MNWLAFWDSPHSIYVNARHRDIHYRLIAEQIAALLPSPQARVLDYGSGEALYADLVAAASAELLLCEGAPGVRSALAARFAGNPKIRALAPDDVKGLPDRSLDLIVLHSVAQYLTPETMAELLALFHRLLGADGKLVVSDVIPPQLRRPLMPWRFCDLVSAMGFSQQPLPASSARCFPIIGACARITG